MRFYKLIYTRCDTDKITGVQEVSPHSEWFPSERDAVVRRLDLFKRKLLTGKKSDHVIEAHDVPTDKQGLLRWLKENAV